MNNETKIIKSKMIAVPDADLAVNNEQLYFNLFNVNKCPEIFNEDPKNLTFYAAGTKARVKAFKNADVYNGLRVVGEKDLSNMEWITWISAILHNKLEVSPDNGKTGYSVKLVPDVKNQAALVKMKETVINESHKLTEMFWHKLEQSTKNKLFNLKSSYDVLGGVISYVDDELATKNSIRLQLIFPQDHPRKPMFNPGEVPTKFYHHYDGHLYELPATLISAVGEFYEWDIKGLEPGKVYAGLSFSTDGGNNILPSTALFGITLDENGEQTLLDDAELAVPAKEVGLKNYKMWSEELAKKFMGNELTKTTYDVIVKKQFEHDNEDGYVPLSNVDEYYDNYPWLKTGKE